MVWVVLRDNDKLRQSFFRGYLYFYIFILQQLVYFWSFYFIYKIKFASFERICICRINTTIWTLRHINLHFELFYFLGSSILLKKNKTLQMFRYQEFCIVSFNIWIRIGGTFAFYYPSCLSENSLIAVVFTEVKELANGWFIYEFQTASLIWKKKKQCNIDTFTVNIWNKWLLRKVLGSSKVQRQRGTQMIISTLSSITGSSIFKCSKIICVVVTFERVCIKVLLYLASKKQPYLNFVWRI